VQKNRTSGFTYRFSTNILDVPDWAGVLAIMFEMTMGGSGD